MEPESYLIHNTRHLPLPNPIHAPAPFLEDSFLILTSHLRLRLPRLSGVASKTLYAYALFPTRAKFPTYLNLLDLITLMIFGEECRKKGSSLCTLLPSPVTSSLLDPNILLSTKLSNTLRLCSSLNTRRQISHPYKTSNIIILCIFIVLASKLEDKRFCTKWYLGFRALNLLLISSRVEFWLILIIKPTASKPVWHIPLLCVQWKTPDDGQRNCPKHVVLFQTKFEKLVHLVGFITRIYHDERSLERNFD